MKKHVLLLMAITNFSFFASATTFYVDPVNGLDTNNGASWKTAVKTINAASTLASSNIDIDDIFVKAGNIIATGTWRMNNENFYGSFQGTESKPNQRILNDNDGNGIVEPWEFKSPTIYTINYNNTAINGSTAILDGFTIAHIGTRSNAPMTTLISPIGGKVQNCVFTGSNLTYTGMIVNNGGCILKTQGTVKDCLFEKNTISISLAGDCKIAPILDIAFNQNPTTAIVSGCVFRNNRVTVDNSASTVAPKALRGMILNISAVTSTPKSTVSISNCLIHNNDVSYLGNNTSPIAEYASIAGSLNYSKSNSSDSFVNCTFACNKLTDTKNSVLQVATNGLVEDPVIHIVQNNVFWNNQHTTSSTDITKNVSMSSTFNQNKGSSISNNVMDGNTTGNWGSNCNYENNLTNLSKSNTGKNAPNFKLPTTVAGITTDGSSEKSNWRINSSSYLIGKGTDAPEVKTDKTGKAYSTPRSSGAYEL